MELTWRRWLAIAVGSAIFLGVVFRPAPQQTAFTKNPNAKWQREHALLTYRGQLIDAQLLSRRFADSVMVALKHSKSLADVVFDSRIPAPVRAEISKRANPILVTAATATTPLALAVTLADQRGITRNSGNMLFILPDRINGGPCVVVLRIPVRHLDKIAPAERDAAATKFFHDSFTGFPTAQDMGPCGFFNAFGAPTTEIALALRTQGWIVASAGYAPGSQAPPALWGVNPFFDKMFGNRERADGIVACASGRRETCAEGVFGRGITFGPVLAPPADYVVGARLAPLRGNSAMRAHLLDDMARDMGPEKFGKLWHSPNDIPTAYAAVMGEPYDVYLMRWLQRAIGKTYVGPQLSVHILFVALASVLAGFAVGVAVHSSRRIS